MKAKVSKFIKYIVICGVVLFISFCFICKPITIKDYLSYIGYSITGTTLLSVLYVKWGWRWNPFERTPKLSSRYRGTLITNYENRDKKIDVNVSIKQTLLSTEIAMYTQESSSYSISSEITIDNQDPILTYCYKNRPKASVSARSKMHYGAAFLTIRNECFLEGIYFNERKSIGDIRLESVEKNTEGK